jgi:hypothetical protein
MFFGAAFFGYQFWSAILQTLTADLFPPAMVGSVAGLLGQRDRSVGWFSTSWWVSR